MSRLPRPSLWDILEIAASRFRAWRARESTYVMWRRLLCLGAIVALGLAGPFFIKLWIFPDRPTGILSPDGCVYNAVLGQAAGRFSPPPTPTAAVTGTLNAYELHITNSGTCTWQGDVTLMREGGDLPTWLAAMTPIEPTPAAGLLRLSIVYTAPNEIGIYNSTWRMHAPNQEAFGPSFTFSIVTYNEGQGVVYPSESQSLLGKLLLFVLFLLPGFAGLFSSLYRSGRFVTEFYSLKPKSAGLLDLEPSVRLLFGFGNKPKATAQAGQLAVNEQDKEIEDMGGPGTLSIHANTTALIERGSGFSRMAGPGSTQLIPFERVRKVIDARPLSRAKADSARTKDGIEVKAETTVSFQILQRNDEEEQRYRAAEEEEARLPAAERQRRQARRLWAIAPLDSLFFAWLGFHVRAPKLPAEMPASLETIRAIVYDQPAGSNWENSVGSGLDGEIAARLLDDLWEPDDPSRNPRREIIEKLLDAGQKKQRKNGIELIDLSVGPLQVNDEIAKLRREWWQAIWVKDQRVTQAEGDAEALQLRELARVEAQARMIQAITQGLQGLEPVSRERLSQLIALRFIDTIESIAGIWLNDESRDSYLNMLNELRKLSEPGRGLENGNSE